MALNSLERLLQHIQRQPGWEALRRYQAVLLAWERIIDPTLLNQTKPMGIQRGRLNVAVVSPALAQTLQLQRWNLLQRLNAQLQQTGEATLTDLRFSPLHWHQRRSPTNSQPSPEIPLDPLPTVPPAPPTDPPRDAQDALDRWLHTLERRSSVLPTCPQCESPVLERELKRWGCCSACARQWWQQPSAQSRPETETPP